MHTLDQMGAFAQHCQSIHQLEKLPHPDFVILNEVEPLKKVYLEIFGEDISALLIVKIISRGLYHQLPDGWAVHTLLQVPAYLVKTIEHCGIKWEYRPSQTIDKINVAPNVSVFVWKTI
jgi:hypothetical protein